jgi:hypothetical protein
LAVSVENTDESVYSSLPFRVDPRRVGHLTFIISLLSQGQGGSGGAGLDVFLSDDRAISFDVGPSEDGVPELYFSTCRAPRAGEEFTPDSSCDHPDGGPITPGDPILIDLSLDDLSINVAVNGIPASMNLNGAYPDLLQFYISASEGAEFWVTVDELRATLREDRDTNQP